MIEVDINFPQNDIDMLFHQINRAEKKLNKSSKDAIAWAGSYLCNSIAARTKQAPKLRRIVRNPDKRYKTDRRRAPFGVYVYKKGKKVFKPIFRTGEYGKIRFYDKNSASWFERHGPNRNTWRKVASGPDIANPEIIVPGIKRDRRRIIGRRGLAKKTWKALAKLTKRNGYVTTMNVKSGQLQWSFGGLSLKISNNLDYARDALKSNINEALNAAAKKLAYRIDQQIEKKLTRGLA